MLEYKERFYRQFITSSDLYAFTVQIKESDLMIYGQSDLSQFAHFILDRERRNLEAYIRYQPQFRKALNPVNIADFAPPICKLMAEAGSRAHVGPMAAVAGAINDRLATELLPKSSELIIENGGDVLVHSSKERTIAIYAGEDSPFRSRIGLSLPPGRIWGVATSSGLIGHSLSLGKSDAVTIVAESSALADAWATRIGNMVHTKKDVEKTLKFCENNQDIMGVIIIIQDVLGVRGDIQLVRF